ncbi:MAG: DUF3368 domain-containing protein [Euryarchaeota archaeon]|nr:DUF3368 domain-containing protein [Euryarchaeota archaeon]
MKAVADSSVLISLSQIGLLNLLREMFSGVTIPEAVYYEVVERGQGRRGAREVEKAEWIKVEKVQNVQMVKALAENLDVGEAEAITLALEHGADFVLLDEKDARKRAKKLGLRVLGTIGVLVWGKKSGRVEHLKPLLESLIRQNFRISNEMFVRILKEVGEA